MLNRIKYITHIKKLGLLLWLTGSFTSSYAQSVAQNYIRTRVPRKAIATLTRLDSLTPNKDSVQASIQYIDGLGRPVQTVQVKASTNGMDVVQPVTYDGYGREAVKYLPYAAATTTGVYQTNAFADQMAFYNPVGTPAGQPQLAGGIAHIISPFAQTLFEASPLNRVTKQGAPGDPWQPYSATDHTIKMDYQLNNDISWAADPVNSRQVAFYSTTFNTSGNQSQTLTRNGTYVAGELSVTVGKDENWASGRGGTVEEYKDKEGRVVLKRTFNTVSGVITPLSTYYVYDDFGNLAFVLPPKADADNASSISQTTLDNLCYQYRYDERQRLTQKQLPGKGLEYMIYNKLDQVVATQDVIQRGKAPQEFTISKYDAMGRVVLTGIYLHPSSVAGTDYRAAVQTLVNGFITLWETPTGMSANYGYTSASFPATVSTTFTVNYYDDYSFAGANPYPYASGTARTRGLPTGSLANVLSTANMLWSVIYEDEHGRTIKAYKQHYLGGGTSSTYNYDEITSTYNFNDQITAVTRKHYAKNTGGTAAVLAVTIANTYGYDHMGRKINTFEKINTGSNILLSKNDYNEIGQLKTKHLHGATGAAPYLQDIDYAYNDRGWLSKINDPAVAPTAAKVFGMALNYNSGTTPQYNGNISGISWLTKVPTGMGLSQTLQSYAYTYDQLNQLKLASYTTAGALTKFDEEVGYDLNGNIQTLKRKNVTTTGVYLNNFTYDYTTSGTGNKLWGVADAGTANQGGTYTYDDNGNVKTDTRNQITGITYNILNLPQIVNRTPGNITYIYDATGARLRKVSGSITRDYISGIEYNNGVIEFVATEEGRAIAVGSVYSYEYFLKDHLGNTRATVKQDGSIGQVQDYYAFGMAMNPGNTNPANPVNNYKYNGKELQDETGQYDYGARFYDPVIARWNTIDPLAEKSRRWSPYNYVMNNPVRNIDPDGMEQVVGPFGVVYEVAGGNHFSNEAELTSDKGAISAAAYRKQFPELSAAYFQGLADASDLQWDLNHANPNSGQNGHIQLLSGGVIRGNHLDANFIVTGTPAQSLQIIQTVYMSEGAISYGKNSYNGYDAFVDGGKYSQAGEQTPGKPYLYTPKQLAKESNWSKSAGDINAYDEPSAVRGHSMIRFETIIVAVNFNNTGHDKILGAFQWGFTNFGRSPATQNIVLKPNASDVALKILRADYPNYKFE